MLRYLLTAWLFFWACAPAASWATIYVFTDERGVRHFTNVPDDPRYRPFIETSPPAGPAAAGKNEAAVESHIRQASSRFDVDPHLVKAVIRAESNFDHRAVSTRGAMGLMQLMPETARDMEVADPFDQAENIHGGTRYLKKLLQLFDHDLTRALAAYNAGPTLVRQLGGVPNIAETRAYINRVLAYYQHYTASPL